MKLAPTRPVIASLVAAAPLTFAWFAFNQTLLVPRGNPFANLAVWLVLAACLVVAHRWASRRLWLVAALVAVPMAVSRTLGAHFDSKRVPPFHPAGSLLPVELAVDWLACAVFAVAGLALLSRARPLPRPEATGRSVWARWIAVSGLVMLLGWLPYLLIFWPGIMVRDSWSSIFLGTGKWPMSNHHPVAFNLWVGMWMDLATALGRGTTAGVALFAISQAVILALGLGVVVAWARYRWGVVVARVMLAFFALSPQAAMWSITMHKDTLFVMWTTLMAVLLVEVSCRGLAWLSRPLPLATFGGLSLAMSFTRNNGPLVVAGLVAMLALLLAPRLLRPRRHGWHWWRIPVAGVLLVASVLVVQGPLFHAWGVVPSEKVESYGLPLQQIGWSVTYGKVSAEQLETVEKFMPVDEMRAKFTPTIADSLKFDKSFKTEWINSHPDEFLTLWRDMASANKRSYLKAWYGLAGGYTDPGRFFSRFDPGTKKGAGKLVVHDRDLLGSALGTQQLTGPVVRNASHITRLPGPNLAFAMPLLTWLCLLGALGALLGRTPLRILPYLPMLGIVATLLIAAPVTDFRYVAAGHFALPVLVMVFWEGARGLDSQVDSRHGEAAGRPPAPSEALPDDQ